MEDGKLLAGRQAGRLTALRASPAVATAINAVLSERCAESRAMADLRDYEPSAAIHEFERVMSLLRRHGAVAAELWSDTTLHARLQPRGRDIPAGPAALAGPLSLVRFAHIARASELGLGDEDVPVLSAPGVAGYLEIRSQEAAALTAAWFGATPRDPGEAGELSGELRDLLFGAGLLVGDGDEHAPTAGRDRLSAYRTGWEFHDAVFDSATRWDSEFEQPLPLREQSSATGASAPLVRVSDGRRTKLPASGDSRVDRMSVVTALSRRRSRRDHSGPPVDLADLGELLGRSARFARTVDGTGSSSIPLAWRSAPSAGALTGLDTRVVAARVADLTPGLYRYDPLAHELIGESQWCQELASLIDFYGRSAAMASGDIQSAFVFTLRYTRPATKYRSTIYASSLKEFGAMMQTIYLVGEALGLSVCAVSGGQSSLFIRAAEVEPGELPIGEVLVGRGGSTDAGS